ncbi:MAG: glycosyltransferase family 4 protein [candidate division KSB1 bacterium]|nr:glycosyltransferase family 4 protein [candidate division KSB1 bacterium]
MAMKVCILFQSDFPPEVRLERTATTLLEAGHQVTIVCDNRKDRPHEEEYQGAHIRRIRNIPPTSGGVGHLIRLPIFWNPVWIAQFVPLVLAKRFDVLHAINLTMVPLALAVGRMVRIPVVYDMYENYPAALRSWNLQGTFNRIFRNPRAADVLDRVCVRMADFILVVTEEAEERVRQLGVHHDRIAVVHNTPNLKAMREYPLEPEIVARYRRNYTILYTGWLSAERGLETVVDAMPRIRARIPQARLVIAGGGPHEQALRRFVHARAAQDYVEFTGWIDHSLFPSYITAARVCIVPHPADPSINTTSPNKLFEYMALGKPVVVSDARPLARVVRTHRCGEVFASGNPESFADAVLRLRGRESAAGSEGKRAVLETYNWEVTSQVLLSAYRRLERLRPPRH